MPGPRLLAARLPVREGTLRLGDAEIVPSGFRIVVDNGTLWYQPESAAGVSAGTDVQGNFGVEA